MRKPLQFHASKHHDKPQRATIVIVLIALLAVAVFGLLVWIFGFNA